MRNIRSLATSNDDAMTAGAFQMSDGLAGVSMNMNSTGNLYNNTSNIKMNSSINMNSSRNNRSEGRIIKQTCRIRPPLHKQIKNNDSSPVGELANLLSGHSYDNSVVLPDLMTTRLATLSANSGIRADVNDNSNNHQPISVVRRNSTSLIVKRTLTSPIVKRTLNTTNNNLLPPLNSSLTMNSSGGIEENISANGSGLEINIGGVNNVTIRRYKGKTIKQSRIRSKSPIIRPNKDDNDNIEFGLTLNINHYNTT